MNYAKNWLLSLLLLAPSLYASERGRLPKEPLLHMAIQIGLFDMIPDLLALETTDIGDTGYYQRTALHVACVTRNPEYAPEKQHALKECIKILLDHASSSLINEKDYGGNSALYYLVPTTHVASDPDLFATFLNYGADPNSYNIEQRTCLDALHENFRENLAGKAEKNLFLPTYKTLSVINEHEKQLEQRVREKTIDQALRKIMSADVVNIISGYACCGIKLNPANRRKLDAIFILYSDLFESLHKEGDIS